MKNNTLKLLLLLLFLVNFSCNNDDDSCDDNIIPVDFTIQVKLLTEDGENLFNNSDFNISLLNLTDPTNLIASRAFSQITVNGEELISFDAQNMNAVNFVYDNENKFYFGFHDVINQTINCSIKVVNYKAKKLNGDLVCDCSSGDILVISLDL